MHERAEDGHTRNDPILPAVSAMAQMAARWFAGQGQASMTATHSVEDVLAWLDRNKYPLLGLSSDVLTNFRSYPAFPPALEAEREWYGVQRQEYAEVREAWAREGLDCLMFKSAGNAPSFPHLSDNIDILLRPEDASRACATLRRLGFVEVRNVEEPGKYLFRKFRAGRCVSAIHVHEQVAWFVGFMDDAALWSRMRPSTDDPLVNVPSPEDAILINLAHACYENKRLRFNDVLRIRHALLTASGAVDWPYLERVAASRGWLDGLAFLFLVYAWLEPQVFESGSVPRAQQERYERIVRADPISWQRLQAIRSTRQIEFPLDLGYWFCKWLYYRKIFADPARTGRQRWRDAWLTFVWGLKLKSGLRPQPGMVVSLSGPDGSGKTAHARALMDALHQCGISADYLWSRGGSSGLLSALRVLASRLAHAPVGDNSDHLSRRRKRLSHPVIRFMWSWLVVFDQLSTYALRAALPSLVGRVVICDRHLYDAAIEMDATLPIAARWSRLAMHAMLRLAPRPHRAYVLDVSSATAHERKLHEAWSADREGERWRYRALAEDFGLPVLSTEGSFAETNDRLVQQVIVAYMDGFETWLNALFLSNPSQRNPRPRSSWVREGAR